MTITIKFTDNIEHKHNSVKDILQNKDKYHTITYIDCNHKNLFSLPELPNSLIELYCYHNKLSSLPQIPNSSTDINYFNNPIYTHIEHYFNGDIKKYFEHQTNMKRNFINKIENWFLDCKYNPKYLYCRKRLMKEYEELYN